MISRPWLSAITHVTSCPEREINITTAGACPIIFPTTTYRQKPIKMHLTLGSTPDHPQTPSKNLNYKLVA